MEAVRAEAAVSTHGPENAQPRGEGVYEMTSRGSETATQHLPRGRSSGPITIGGGTIGFRPKTRGLRRFRQAVPQNPGDPAAANCAAERGRFHQPFRFRDCSCLSLIGAAWSKQTHSPYWKLGQRAEVRRLQKRCQIARIDPEPALFDLDTLSGDMPPGLLIERVVRPLLSGQPSPGQLLCCGIQAGGNSLGQLTRAGPATS